MEKKKVIVICGPTASGKTALSIWRNCFMRFYANI